MKPKPKARLMWAELGWQEEPGWVMLYGENAEATEVPVLVIPLDPASLAALRERVARALCLWGIGAKWQFVHPATKAGYLDEALAALVAVHPAMGNPTPPDRRTP